jgi:hypothetical protein
MWREVPAAAGVVGRAVDDWWSSWVSLAALSPACLLCLVSVVLAAPATLVLFRVAQLTASGDSFTAVELLRMLGRYFWKGWQWLLLNLLAGAGFWINSVYYARLETRLGAVLLLVSWFLFVLWLALQFQALPWLVFQRKPSLRLAYRNGLLTLLASPLHALIVLGCAGLLLYAGLRLPLLWFLGLPALLALLAVHSVRERLAAFGLVVPHAD